MEEYVWEYEWMEDNFTCVSILYVEGSSYNVSSSEKISRKFD